MSDGLEGRIESVLPPLKYVRIYTKEQISTSEEDISTEEGNEIMVRLDVKLPTTFRDYERLKELLVGNRVAIDVIESEPGLLNDRIIYAGALDGGSYMLRMTDSFLLNMERIKLEANGNETDIIKLVAAMRDYTAEYEERLKQHKD